MSELLRRTVGETIVCVETVLGAGLWRTFVDANQLENVLLNLAVNARDAMPNSSHLTVETSNAYLDEAYTSAVRRRRRRPVPAAERDRHRGVGMTPELLARVFEPFFSTKGGDQQGSGLGLAMVHGFVKQSGGHIRIYSEPRRGHLGQNLSAAARAKPAADAASRSGGTAASAISASRPPRIRLRNPACRRGQRRGPQLCGIRAQGAWLHGPAGEMGDAAEAGWIVANGSRLSTCCSPMSSCPAG